MANTNINLKYGAKENLPAIENGQLLFTTDEGAIYLDVNGERINLYKTLIAAATQVGTDAQDDVDTLTAAIGTPETGKTIVEMIADVKKLITGEGESPDDQTLTQKVAKNAADIATNAAAIAKLTATSGEGSIADTVTKELAKALIPEDANEALDTLGEIAAWIQGHPDDVATMNASIAANKTAIDELKTALGVTITPPEGGDGPGTETPIVSVADTVKAAIEELDVTDVAEDGKYVSAVAEVDGKIQVTRADLPAMELAWGTF